LWSLDPHPRAGGIVHHERGVRRTARPACRAGAEHPVDPRAGGQCGGALRRQLRCRNRVHLDRGRTLGADRRFRGSWQLHEIHPCASGDRAVRRQPAGLRWRLRSMRSAEHQQRPQRCRPTGELQQGDAGELLVDHQFRHGADHGNRQSEPHKRD
ncbi:hypothetical protein LTR94_032516, partial [Friedmanniomyces endolithicus]